MLVDLHRALAAATVVAVVLLFAVAVGGRAAGRFSRLWTDRLILLVLATLALSVVVGLGQLASGDTPADPLHFVYAVAAAVTLPIARGWATGAHTGRRWLALTLGAIVLGALVARLYMTGA